MGIMLSLTDSKMHNVFTFYHFLIWGTPWPGGSFRLPNLGGIHG